MPEWIKAEKRARAAPGWGMLTAAGLRGLMHDTDLDPFQMLRHCWERLHSSWGHTAPKVTWGGGEGPWIHISRSRLSFYKVQAAGNKPAQFMHLPPGMVQPFSCLWLCKLQLLVLSTIAFSLHHLLPLNSSSVRAGETEYQPFLEEVHIPVSSAIAPATCSSGCLLLRCA